MKTIKKTKEIWNPASEFYKALKEKKHKHIEKSLLLHNLLKTNLQLLKNMDLSNTVLF